MALGGWTDRHHGWIILNPDWEMGGDVAFDQTRRETGDLRANAVKETQARGQGAWRTVIEA
jgi:hypothetical protein